ncbi:MAG: DUF523 domain-containing protein [Actinomycetota bacterium]|nr:DUF523 domain-containing protein [Actinomycetota bacterium]
MKIPEEGPVLLSACLAGIACTHEAQPKTRAWALKLVAEGRAVPVCPEVAGGLPIPRPEAEIQQGDGADVLDGRARVVSIEGHDVTENYLKGARLAAAAAKRSGAEIAIMKARSPSCGCACIYDGTFSGTRRGGDGVTSALLRREGVAVVSDENIGSEEITY